jgi:hypothetical protein
MFKNKLDFVNQLSYLYLDRFEINSGAVNPRTMHIPNEQEFKTAKKLLQSDDLEYEAATVCAKIVKAFIMDEEIPHHYISKLQEFQYAYEEN